MPIGFTLIIVRNRHVLDTEDFKTKFGTLTERLRTRSLGAALWNMALLFKWFTYSNILLFLSEYPGV